MVAFTVMWLAANANATANIPRGIFLLCRAHSTNSTNERLNVHFIKGSQTVLHSIANSANANGARELFGWLHSHSHSLPNRP